jgi:hypothetical protein
LRSGRGINWARKVTFMSPEDKAEMRAKALLHYTESVQEVAMLRDKITESGDFYIRVGEQIKSDPFMYLSKQYDFAPQAEIENLIRKWMEATDETERLKQKAISYGASL